MYMGNDLSGVKVVFSITLTLSVWNGATQQTLEVPQGLVTGEWYTLSVRYDGATLTLCLNDACRTKGDVQPHIQGGGLYLGASPPLPDNSAALVPFEATRRETADVQMNSGAYDIDAIDVFSRPLPEDELHATSCAALEDVVYTYRSWAAAVSDSVTESTARTKDAGPSTPAPAEGEVSRTVVAIASCAATLLFACCTMQLWLAVRDRRMQRRRNESESLLGTSFMGVIRGDNKCEEMMHSPLGMYYPPPIGIPQPPPQDVPGGSADPASRPGSSVCEALRKRDSLKAEPSEAPPSPKLAGRAKLDARVGMWIQGIPPLLSGSSFALPPSQYSTSDEDDVDETLGGYGCGPYVHDGFRIEQVASV
eukprot:TRINITY_DN3785_c0_g1_i11.p2 TRINITY_DN3785_c0_g1~~TRINITY_DN3785_c0_g1_i11.p2  ORF type:complete len:365 (+),score=64.81 TRINITY_DN3785_c0_g1_i11:2199-3293(+)